MDSSNNSENNINDIDPNPMNNDDVIQMINNKNYPQNLLFLADTSYNIVNENIINLIEDTIIPNIYQDFPDDISKEQLYFETAKKLSDPQYNFTFEEIYNGIANHMIFNNLPDNFDIIMDHARRAIITMYYIKFDQQQEFDQSMHMAMNLFESLSNTLNLNRNNINSGEEKEDNVEKKENEDDTFDDSETTEESENDDNIFNASNIRIGVDIPQSYGGNLRVIASMPINPEDIPLLLQMQIPLQQNDSIKLTVPKEELDKIPILDYENLSDDIKKINEMCTICQCNFEKTDKVRCVKCNHVFHSECIDKWLLESNYMCPVCRTPVAEHKANI